MAQPLLNPDKCRAYVEELLFPTRSSMDTTGTACIGIELENYTYRETAGGYAPVALYGNDSLVESLLDISRGSGGQPKYHESNGAPLVKAIEFPDGCRFLFEPGGQVEISTTPCNTIGSLDLQLQSMQDILSSVTHQRHIRFGQQGTNPLFRGDQLSNQIPLPRYIALEKYFNAIGPYGRQMMLQTCGLHINMDAGHSDTVRIKRMLAANLLVPFATALFANSAVVGGENTGYKSYRSHIWQQADPFRTGILPVHRILESMDREELV
ncbi:MAG: glutamate-cysteine ligase family protein, partial [Chitinophagaceae bacterium]|nr:glutamate-cysteine ligase family protein [Chitinophagaceae bacterium]